MYYWRQEEKGKTEDEVAGWHHWLDGRESEWTGVGDGQGVLACCNSWGHKESDTTERLNWIRPYNTKKRCPFHHKGLECKSRKSRDTWNSRQVWPWSTKWSRAKANRVLPRECTGHSKHPLPTTQEKTTNGHHQMVNTKIRLIIFFVAKDRETLYSQQKQDQEWTVTQIMNSLLPNSDLNWRK